MILKSFSEKETEAFGEKLAKKLTGNEILALYGGLGAGKTCFTRGIAKGLSVNENTVHSPTFALLNEYSGKFKVYHFDMYRINSLDSLYSVGFFDFLDTGIIITEWSENIDEFLPNGAIKVHLSYGQNENERVLSIEGMDL